MPKKKFSDEQIAFALRQVQMNARLCGDSNRLAATVP